RFSLYEMIYHASSHIRLGGHHIINIIGDRNLFIMADENGLDQVIVNLVNNAVKYAGYEKEIIIRYETIKDHYRISIEDHGPGIAADKLNYLFDRYYRVNNSVGMNTGLGLGLYISAEIVKSHGGRIGVESVPGKG